MTVPRLSPATVDAPDRPDTVGILHLGPGAFHRAHQAVFTEEAGGDWGICGVTQRSATVADQLRPQDCLFTVVERGRDTTSCRVVGSIRDVLFARDEPERLRDRFTDPAVRIVSLTVTEKGYQPDSTVIEQLVAGLNARRERTGAPVTILPCDNLTGNGRVVRARVLDACGRLPDGDALGAWIEEHVRFPSTMVDRIVPATTEADRAVVRDALGVRDEAAVVAEPFRQWVIEDDFAAGRPAWETVGAQLADDVAPYEAMKLRMLNGTHSLLAYRGALAGHGTIADAVADAGIAEEAAALMTHDVPPTLTVPADVDLAAYREQVLQRFANPALRHRTTQVAMDGSQKLPLRLLGTIRDRLAAGAVPVWALRAVAAWMVYVAVGEDRQGRRLPLDDPLADRLRAAVGDRREPADVVTRLLAVREIFDGELREHAVVREVLVDAVAELLGAR
ncbi:mannitol dehydrogenase family protein [Saccharomonospora azurea]|uniref:mannitol dehydrogenase family protein n=1 Tax=Saccharomonospora azurea TaxID=40988 RepID=UPI003D909AA7